MAEDWLEKCRRVARALPQAKRQEFLDHIWSGKTIGESRALAGLDFDQANGVMHLNLVERTLLRTESV